MFTRTGIYKDRKRKLKNVETGLVLCREQNIKSFHRRFLFSTFGNRYFSGERNYKAFFVG